MAEVSEVVQPSGHWTFRIAFDTSDAKAARAKVVDRLREFGCRIEWQDPAPGRTRGSASP